MAKRERIIFQSDGATEDPYRQAGTLEAWQREVAALCVGNSRLTFALSAAFTGPLLHPCEAEGGGFHFRGGSSIGKTTALLLAGSAWGALDFIRTWRATSNGLEGVCAMHNDTLLLLDEMGQADGREVAASAYMIANGQGKTRASRNGTARRPARWRTIFLSTGELSLADKIAEDGRGRRAAAGQEVRIVDIPADAGAGLGIFEDLHGFPSADAFARHLKAAVGKDYGLACHPYLQRLVNNYDAIAPTVKAHVDRFTAKHCPAGADGQVSRVCARFALVAAAGEMATAFGVLPWPAGEASKAAARCFADWIAERGGIAPAEEREHVAAVRRFIELHGSSRFEAMGALAPKDSYGAPIDQKIINRAGYRRLENDSYAGDEEFIFLPEVWKTEVCVGLDPTAVAKTLAKKGLLKTEADGKRQKLVRLPGVSKAARCYVVPAGIMGESAS